MKSLSFILLQITADSSSTLVGSLVTTLLIIVLCIGVFLLIRSIMLWYWKVDTIVNNQERQTVLLSQLSDGQNRRNARTNYYKASAIGDNRQAYESLLYIVFYDLTDPKLNSDGRKVTYDNLKNRYVETFNKIGYEFPEYPF